MSNVSVWCSKHRRVISLWLFAYCLLMTLIVLGNASSMGDLYQSNTMRSTDLNSNWTVYEDDTLIGEGLALPYRPSTKKVGKIVLQHTLPDTGYQSVALVTSVYQTVLTVELDGNQLYKTPYRETKLNHTPGSAQVVVPLPQGYAGKTLTITLDRVVARDTTGATYIKLVDLMSWRSLSLISNSSLFFAMCALVVVGLVLAGFSVAYDRAQLLTHPLFYLAAFTLVTPIWVLCNTKLVQFFTTNLVLIHNIEYITFFLFPLPMLAFLHTNWKERPASTQLAIDLMVIFYTLAITIKVTGIADFQALTLVYHMMLLLIVAPLFISSAIYGLRGKDLSLKLFFCGFIGVALAGVADLCIFYLLPGKQPMMLLWGITAMGICLIVSYLMTAKTRIVENVEDSLYKALAYTDKLTGLPNRLTFEEDVEQLSKEITRHRSIIFINTDVNKFKHINDSYGHMMGDRVLRDVASVLQRSFDGVCKCYRMGGDEFCLIAIDQDPRQLDALLGKVNGELDRIVVEFSVSIAHGMAEYNSFLHHDLMDVFKSADDLMYEYKRTRNHR